MSLPVTVFFVVSILLIIVVVALGLEEPKKTSALPDAPLVVPVASVTGTGIMSAWKIEGISEPTALIIKALEDIERWEVNRDFGKWSDSYFQYAYIKDKVTENQFGASRSWNNYYTEEDVTFRRIYTPWISNDVPNTTEYEQQALGDAIAKVYNHRAVVLAQESETWLKYENEKRINKLMEDYREKPNA